jgi:hydroxymethylpyrimidine/phosphomethylpyrimidine kinase/hydroxymethylpyrimidine kinase/phosphomethylpyrimidine kinase/thiamine-phosphate diphosphorylase
MSRTRGATAPTRPISVLSIAGSDPSGGAGIQADLKTVAAHGGYGMAAITALTAQNTQGVRAVHVPPADFLREQLEALADDVRIDAVKIGMLGTAEVVDVVADWLSRQAPPHVVLDPVMVSQSGHRLLPADAVSALRRRLLACADVVTPNLPELADLLGREEAASWPDALAQGRELAQRHQVRVLVKGGHLSGPRSPDALVDVDGAVRELPGLRVATPHTHGTGCTLSTAVATLRPSRADWYEAVRDAKTWLAGAIEGGRGLRIGQGRGPVDHLHDTVPSSARAFTTQAWDETTLVRASIDDLPFVRALADGTLPQPVFAEYLRQDALYLQQYARALATLAALAPDADQQLWWAQAAQQAIAVERQLHESWVDVPDAETPSDVPAASAACTAYTSYLLAVAHRGDYAELVAAVLPCFWVYADVGERLLERTREAPDHPYRRWIDQYGDPVFAERTRQARDLADRTAARSGPAARARMLEAFRTATRYEWMFWDAPWRGSHWPV